MSAENPADIIPLTPAADGSSGGGVARRTVLQTLAAGVSAAFAIPGIAEAQQHPMQHHIATGTAAAAQKKVAGAYTPVLFDTHQMKTLEVLSEAIVPGSTEAKVAPFLDTLVAVDSTDNQRSFMSALGAFDMFAIDKYNKPWIALSPVEQDTLLQTASTTAPGNRPSFPGAPPATTGKATIGDHFNNLKGWIAGAYFSSEKGARELGWDGNVFHTELPGCTHPDGHS